MQRIYTYKPFFLSAVLLAVVLIIIYPYYQYYVDPDATAYLTIVKRYVAGDYEKAINSYWSPWSCWLTALLVKAGFGLFSAAIIINAIGATGVLAISQTLFVRFRLQKSMQWLLQVTLSLFLCYAVFKQTFDDLWMHFFLLTSLYLLLSERYKNSRALWVLNGALGAAAYFAKAYALPFFILNVACCSFVIANGWQRTNRRRWLAMSVTPVVVMLVCSAPWLYMLHAKYGVSMASSVGRLSTSWYLVGHPIWKDGIDVLLPPVYPDSPYYWEDAYMVNGETPHFWDSFELFLIYIAKLGLMLLKLGRSMVEVSAFFLPVSVLAISVAFCKKLRSGLDNREFILLVSFLLFPLGYMLVLNFEARYLWYMLPLSMIIGTVILQRYVLPHVAGRVKRFIVLIFAASYLVFPLLDMKGMFKEGKAEYNVAQQLKRSGIQGSFTGNVTYGPQVSKVARLAYFSGNSYYHPWHTGFSKSQLLKEMRRYKIKYYFHYQLPFEETDFVLTDENRQPFPELASGMLPGLKVFLVNP